jgi:hypothetical protein
MEKSFKHYNAFGGKDTISTFSGFTYSLRAEKHITGFL